MEAERKKDPSSMITPRKRQKTLENRNNPAKTRNNPTPAAG